MSVDGRRIAAIKITPQFLFDVLRLGALFPDAERLGAYFDFDSDTIRLKWGSEKFIETSMGHPIPYINVIYEQKPDGTVVAKSWDYV